MPQASSSEGMIQRGLTERRKKTAKSSVALSKISGRGRTFGEEDQDGDLSDDFERGDG